MLTRHRGVLKSWSASVLLLTPWGIVVVKDPERDNPYWKFPGGQWELEKDGNSPRKTAERELREETGLQSHRPLAFVGKFYGDRKKANEPMEWFLFYGECYNLSGLLERGDGGELITIFPWEFMKSDNFFLQKHWKRLENTVDDGRFQRALVKYNKNATKQALK